MEKGKIMMSMLTVTSLVILCVTSAYAGQGPIGKVPEPGTLMLLASGLGGDLFLGTDVGYPALPFLR